MSASVEELVKEAARAATAPAAPPTEWPDAPRLPGAPPPEPLPLNVLPPALRAHVESVAAATQTPRELGIMLSLAATSAAARGRYRVYIDARGWTEPVCTYSAVALPPASRKSPVYAAMVRPLEEYERERQEEIGPAHRTARDRADVAAARLAAAKQNAAKGKSDPKIGSVADARHELEAAEAAVPIVPRIVVSDATPEAMVKLMAEQGGNLAILGPEADPLNMADGRYSDVPRQDELLRAWSAEPITVDRISREPIHIPRATLTLGLALQPAALEALRHGRVHRGRGLWGRILWCVPEHGLGTRLTGRDVPPLDAAAAEQYARVLRRLLDAASSAVTAGEVHEIELDAAAREILYGYEAEIEAELGDGRELAGLRDWAGKVAGQAVRLAALLSLAARAEDGQPLTTPLGAWAMQGGVELARKLTTHAKHALWGDSDLVYVLRRAREIPVGSTLRDLHDATRDRTGLATMEDLAPLVEELIERGCIRLVKQDRPGPGRKPSPLLELHPAFFSPRSEVHPHNPHNTPETAEPANTAGYAGAFPTAEPETEEWEV